MKKKYLLLVSLLFLFLLIFFFRLLQPTYLPDTIDIFYTPLSILNISLPTFMTHISCAEDSSTHIIYCFGGGTNTSLLDEVVAYNPKTHSFSVQQAKLPSARYQHTCVFSSADNRIYCFGGAEIYNSTARRISEIIAYDPSKDTFSLMNATFPTSRRMVGCAESSKNLKIYCLGGDDALSFFYDDLIVFDPRADTVQSFHLLPQGISGLSCAEDSSTHVIYCFGGMSFNSLIALSPDFLSS